MKYFKSESQPQTMENDFFSENPYSISPPLSESIANMIPDVKPETITPQHIDFFYAVTRATLAACIESKYSLFDAHTAATCCHGVALLAMCLLQEITVDKAKNIREELEKETPNKNWKIPGALMWLCRLYILRMVKAKDPERGYVTECIRLKNFFPLSNRFSSQITKILQKHIANIVAARYSLYLQKLPEHASAHGVPLHLWGQYISSSHSRSSSNGVVYISNLFSMRVVLSHLSFNHCYVALVNDVIDENDIPQYRYISIFAGDGKGGFQLITSPKTDDFSNKLTQGAPVFVLGGAAYLEENIDEDTFVCKMKTWENRLLELVLACDIWYPQFPLVAGDPEFDNTPILPEEPCLQKIIEDWSSVKGVRAEDPSLCCLAHIYPASLTEILNELHQNKHVLPWSFLPGNKRRLNS